MSNQTAVRQAVIMIAMYILGTSFLVAIGINAGRDSWIALLLGLVLSMLLVLLYARLISYIPGKDLFETMEILLGRPFSTVIFILMVVFLFQHYAYVIHHFTGFITEVGLPEAPRLVPLVCLGLLSTLGVYVGIEILGRWSEIFFFFVASFIVIAFLLLTKNMDLNNLRPVMENGLTPIFRGTWDVIAFPFAQTIAFLFVLPPFMNKKDPYKVFVTGLLVGGIFVFIPSVMDQLVLGADSITRLYFPTYSSMAIIQLGEFVQRMEILAATVFTIAIFLKAAILLLAVVKSIGKILGFNKYSFLTIPVVLLAINYSFTTHESIHEFYKGINTSWPMYSTIFQVIIPILLFIIMEFKYARRRREMGGLTAGA